MSDNQKFKAKKAPTNTPASIHRTPVDEKTGTHSIFRNSGVKDQNISEDGKKGIHRTASDDKNSAARKALRSKKK